MPIDQAKNQANYQDYQNFDIDISAVYSDFILSIDKVRSYANCNKITEQLAKGIFKSEDVSLKLKQLVSQTNSLQESRCHAFFRIIGFPVVSQNMEIYNPGYDIIHDSTRSIGPGMSKSKLNIAANPITGFRDLSLKRENFINSMNEIFSMGNIDSSALALSSSVKTRPINTPVINTDSFDMDYKKQQHKVDLTGLVGSREKLLTEYVDVFNNKPTKLNNQRLHIIKPFITDPVIDFTVNDPTKLIAVPFTRNKSDLIVKDDICVDRPLIEKIIRERFSTSNQEDSVGEMQKSLIDYIKSIPSIKDEPLIAKITNNDIYQLSEQNQFLKFLNIIGAMMSKLVEAQSQVLSTQSRYYYLPLPSVSGPEYGCSTQGIFVSKNIGSDFITARDQALIESYIRVTFNKINSQSANISQESDTGGFAFPNFSKTFGPDTSSGLGDLSSQSFDNLNNSRKAEFELSNNSLKTIEIIMGEFSGLGLCDIIAIVGALYLMPKNDLLGFLDVDAHKRMKIALGISETHPGIETTMSSFIKTVKDFYNLMDKTYRDLLLRNNL